MNVMKWNMLFLFICLNLSAATYGQEMRVSLDLEGVTMKEFLEEVQEQTGVNFLYNANLIDRQERVNVRAEGRELRDVLEEVLGARGLTFVYQGDAIVIKARGTENERHVVVGTVRDEQKQPLPGVTVVLKGTTVGTATNDKGWYEVYVPDTVNTVLVFSFIGMETQEIKYTGQDTINVTMKAEVAEMDEVVVTGYQTLKKRSQAGSISVVS